MKNFNVGIKGVVTNQNGGVLLLKKNQQKPFWEVPGGRIDDDESIEQTLEREIQEELTGSSNFTIVQILCAHSLPHDIADGLSLMLIYYQISIKLPDPIQISDEHSEYMWVSSLDQVPIDGGTYKALKAYFEQNK